MNYDLSMNANQLVAFLQKTTSVFTTDYYSIFYR